MDAQVDKQDQILPTAGKTVLHDPSTDPALPEVSRKPGHTPVSLTFTSWQHYRHQQQQSINSQLL